MNNFAMAFPMWKLWVLIPVTFVSALICAVLCGLVFHYFKSKTNKYAVSFTVWTGIGFVVVDCVTLLLIFLWNKHKLLSLRLWWVCLKKHTQILGIFGPLWEIILHKEENKNTMGLNQKTKTPIKGRRKEREAKQPPF